MQNTFFNLGLSDFLFFKFIVGVEIEAIRNFNAFSVQIYKYYNFNGERQIIGEITGNQGRSWKRFEVDLATEPLADNFTEDVSCCLT